MARHTTGRSSSCPAMFEPLEGRRLFAATVATLATIPAVANQFGLPTATVVADAKGNLYTTVSAGTYGEGDLLELPAGGHTLRTVASFVTGDDFLPTGPLMIDPAGNLYGTTFGGTVYEYQTGTGTYRTVFTDRSYAFTSGVTEDAAGNLYVAAANPSGYGGVVIEYQPRTRSESVIATVFGYDSSDVPSGRLAIDAAGNLFGTLAGTQSSGGNGGRVYEVAAGTRAVSTVYTFPSVYPAAQSTGVVPGGLTIDPAGNLFGTTEYGGPGGGGTVFELSAGAHAFSVLATFAGTNGSGTPYRSAPVLDAAGNLYGTTVQSGPDAADQGTVYELPAGSHTIVTLAAIAPAGSAAGTVPTATGSTPSSGLVIDAAGNLYGTTAGYGIFDANDPLPGTIFKVSGALPAVTVAAPGPQFATARAAATFALGTITASGAAAPYQVTVDWGDGTPDTTFADAAAGAIPAHAHTYAATGTDTVTVTVTDAAGHPSNRATFGVTVTATPTATVAGTAYDDRAGDGLTTDDLPLAGVAVTLYRDANGNGRVDAADAKLSIVKTGPAGTYAFGKLPAGAYLVREAVPTGYVRTAPALTDAIAVPLAAGQQATGDDFADFRLPAPPALTHVVYTVNGVVVPTLRGHTFAGATVDVTFTTTLAGQLFSLAAYTAPAATFSADTAAQQQLSGTYSNGGEAGQTYTLTVTLPDSGHYQVDFVQGSLITRFGPAGSNVFYTAQRRLISADNE